MRSNGAEGECIMNKSTSNAIKFSSSNEIDQYEVFESELSFLIEDLSYQDAQNIEKLAKNERQKQINEGCNPIFASKAGLNIAEQKIEQINYQRIKQEVTSKSLIGIGIAFVIFVLIIIIAVIFIIKII